MNKIEQQHDLSKMDLNGLIALRAISEEVKEENAEALQTMRDLAAPLADAKNVADDATTKKGTLWECVMQVIGSVFERTVNTPDLRYIVFSDTLAEFLTQPTTESGEKVKLSTAGQYASTGRKFLIHLTENRLQFAPFAEYKRAAVMDEMKDKAHADLRKAVKDTTKFAAFIIKKGSATERESLSALLAQIKVVYGPVKDRNEGKKAAAVGARELAELRQNHPAAPAVVETVAANIVADEAEAEKQAVNG